MLWCGPETAKHANVESGPSRGEAPARATLKSRNNTRQALRYCKATVWIAPMPRTVGGHAYGVKPPEAAISMQLIAGMP